MNKTSNRFGTTRVGRGARFMRSAAVGTAAAVVATALIANGGVASAATPGVTSSSILLGSHQPLTGPVAPGYSEIAPAAAAMFNYIDATKGGAYGRKIKYQYEDDAYNPTQTATVVRKLVLQDNIFAMMGGLGTPTHEQVVSFLNAEKVPDFFVASGFVGWNSPKKYPYSTGYQTNYQIEGRVLGNYISKHLTGMKVGYLLQNDDIGAGGAAGLNEQIPKAMQVSKQSYDVTALASGLGNQMAALQASGAKVVAVFAVPAAFALAILAAAQIGYHPQFVVSGIAASVSTMTGLISAYSKGKAGAALLQGILTAGYLPSDTDTTSPWIQLYQKVHARFDASEPFDANLVVGMSWAYNFYQLLLKAGKNLTRPSLMAAVNSATLRGPGILPLTFSATDHRGYEGEKMAKFDQGKLVDFGPTYKLVETGPISIYKGALATPPAGF